MRTNSKQNGFTLVELIAVLGIISVVMSAVMMFFSMNVKNYTRVTNDTELQFQADYAINFMTEKIMQCSKVAVATYNTDSYMNSTVEREVKRLVFETDANSIDKYYAFKCNNDNNNNKIFYGSGNSDAVSANSELVTYVKAMYISPADGSELKSAKAVKIRLVFENNDKQYEVQQIIYMRNQKNI